MFEPQVDMRRRIVVIEDSPADVNLLQIAFEKKRPGLDVVVIPDGVQAAAYFERAAANGGTDCDLVLLDLNVPIINGFEILERIKNDRNLRKIPVIIFSGSSSRDDIERCYQAGANCYLCKPTDLTKFFDMIGGVVDYWLNSARLPARSGSAKAFSNIR